jgi:hypothetical protein
MDVSVIVAIPKSSRPRRDRVGGKPCPKVSLPLPPFQGGWALTISHAYEVALTMPSTVFLKGQHTLWIAMLFPVNNSHSYEWLLCYIINSSIQIRKNNFLMIILKDGSRFKLLLSSIAFSLSPDATVSHGGYDMNTQALIPCTHQGHFPHLRTGLRRIHRLLSGQRPFVFGQTQRRGRKVVVKVKILFYES